MDATPQFDIPERRTNFAVFDAHYLPDIEIHLSRWGVNRVVLVASKALDAKLDHFQLLRNQLGERLVGSHIGVASHSPYADVIRIAHLLQDLEADCLVSIGSSSYSDACKIASKLASTLSPGFTAEDMEALVDVNKGSGFTKPASVRLILIPTSLSAAEWNGTGSCTNANGKKQHFGLGNHRSGAADLILCDPEVASTAPERLWLSSGMRCIDHCIETICNRDCSPGAEEDALDSLAEMLTGLIEYKRGLVESRWKQLRSISRAQRGSQLAIKALIVYRNTFGPSHAIGHQLGSVAGVMHGITSCILLAPVLRYSGWSSSSHFSRSRHGQALILETFNEALGWKEVFAADAVTRFVSFLGLPTKLSEVGVTDPGQIDTIAGMTLTDVWGGGEAQITDKEEVKKILEMVK